MTDTARAYRGAPHVVQVEVIHVCGHLAAHVLTTLPDAVATEATLQAFCERAQARHCTTCVAAAELGPAL